MLLDKKDLRLSLKQIVVGIDEVGRGALAGPVSVGIFIALDPHKVRRKLAGIRDSKKLTRKERENWVLKIQSLCKEGFASFRVSSVSPRMIDQKGISHCVHKAICSALRRSAVKSESKILLDGLLQAPPKYKDQKTIIGGDDKEIVISAASVVAKVARDKTMRTLATKYAGYNLETNVGYGTQKHREAIKKLGLSEIHRKTYCSRVLSPVKISEGSQY